MENQELDSKKWKRKQEDLKFAMKQAPRGERTVYFVDFTAGNLIEKKDYSGQENVLPFGKDGSEGHLTTVKPRKKRVKKNTDESK